MSGAAEVEAVRPTDFGGEDWSDEWPEEPSAGCVAACFSDATPTDSSAKVRGLGHAYLSVVANEGIVLFCHLIFFGSSLGTLSVWLTIHLTHTRELPLIIPLIPSTLLTFYCWGYLTLKYRLRCLFYEVVIWPFTILIQFGFSLSRSITRIQARGLTSTMPVRKGAAIVARGPDVSKGNDHSQPLHMETPNGSSFDWSIAKQWITSCQNHQLCQNDFLHAEQKSFLPKRLLEIISGSSAVDSSSEKAGNSCPPDVRLVDTSNTAWLDDGHCYVALSHCFGGRAEDSILSRLKIDNLEKWKVTVPFETLPALFQNAITITSKLGFSYLWIDALCVIDDSEDDQASHLAQRGLVFSNSACTVSISSPVKQFGISLTTKPAIRPIEEDKGLTGPKIRGFRKGIDTLDQLFLRHVDSQALNRWSWTYFQERLLSKRILHICSQDVVLFECNSMRASDHPKYRQGVHYLPSRPTSSPSLPPDSRTTKPLVPGSAGPATPGKTYTYQTRKKVIDHKTGAFKFETLVHTKDHNPSVQEDLEALQASHTWRRHRGEFQRLLRPTTVLSSYVLTRDSTNIHQDEAMVQVEERLGLHSAWLDLVDAYSCWSSLINKGSLDRNRKRLWGLNGAVDIIARTHREDNFQLVVGPYIAGLWLGMMPFNLLWFRANPAIVAVPKQADPEYFSQYPGSVLHYKAPAGSLHSRDRVSSEFQIPTWSWASVDGQISHNLPLKLTKQSGENRTMAALKKLFTSSKPQTSKISKLEWNTATTLIDQLEVYDHWTHITIDLAAGDDRTVLPSQLSQLKLRIRHSYPLFTIPASGDGSKGLHIFYDSIGRLHRAVHPGHDMPIVAEEETERASITRVVFGLPILELGNWGNDPMGTDKSKWVRQLHGLALRHVQTVDGRGDIFERVGYFYTTDQEIIARVLHKREYGNVVWVQ